MQDNTILENNQDMPVKNKEVIELTPSFKNELFSTLKWGKYIGIMLYCTAIVLVLSMISMLVFPNIAMRSAELDGFNEGSFDLEMGIAKCIVFFVLVVVLVLVLVLAYKLHNGCKKFDKGLRNNSQEDCIEGVHNIRIFTLISGVVMIISLFFSIISVFATFVSAIALRIAM